MAHLRVRVTPGARETTIGEWRDGVLRIKVREKPEKGRANEAVIRLLARALDVPTSAVTLQRGATSREKLLEIEDLSESELNRRLGAPML